MYKLFCVGENSECIAATTAQEALDDHLSRYDYGEAETIPLKEINLEDEAMFKQVDGPSKSMTFREIIGDNFHYTEPVLICWKELR